MHGHQILALALGGETYKLKFGHHGINHPVKDVQRNHIYITSQNHGYAVQRNSLPKDVKITHVNLNDKTISGIESKAYNCFSVQFIRRVIRGQGMHRIFLINFRSDVKMNYSEAIEKLTICFASSRYEKDLIKAKRVFFKDVGINDRESESFERWMNLFFDWYLFSRLYLEPVKLRPKKLLK